MPYSTYSVFIDYTNHRGERSIREIIPHQIWYGKTSYHPEKQWLLNAHDVEKEARRDFTLKNIHGWFSEKPLPPT